MALVPGIGSLAEQWMPSMPSFVKMVPVDYQPSGADMNVSAPPDARWGEGRQPGGPGDDIEVQALRLLSASLPHAAAGQSWAIAGHSSGGPVVYRCMELILDLLERPRVAARRIDQSATRWLPSIEAVRLHGNLNALGGRPPPKPLVAISMEGSLLPCDVDGWAADLADPNSASASQLHGSDKVKECTLAADLQERCGNENPPRGLQSISRWLEYKDGPPFAYMAGVRSGIRTKIVFPALEALLNESKAPASKLEIQVVPHAGHEMYINNPRGTRRGFENILLESASESLEGELGELLLDQKYENHRGLRPHATVVSSVLVFLFFGAAGGSVACRLRRTACGARDDHDDQEALLYS